MRVCFCFILYRTVLLFSSFIINFEHIQVFCRRCLFTTRAHSDIPYIIKFNIFVKDIICINILKYVNEYNINWISCISRVIVVKFIYKSPTVSNFNFSSFTFDYISKNIYIHPKSVCNWIHISSRSHLHPQRLPIAMWKVLLSRSQCFIAEHYHSTSTFIKLLIYISRFIYQSLAATVGKFLDIPHTFDCCLIVLKS